MTPFLRTFTFLIAFLLLIVSSINGTLACLGDSSAPSTFICSDEMGTTLYSYQGNLAACPVFMPPSGLPGFDRPLRRRG
jgi:hypothetical protein